MVDKIANLTFIKAIKVGTNDFSEVSNAVTPDEICWVMKVIRVGGLLFHPLVHLVAAVG